MAADDGLSLIGDDQGWQRGAVLPLAQRPIPYAGALRPRLAMPEFLASTGRMASDLLTIPGDVAGGRRPSSPDMANKFATDLLMLGSGIGPSVLDENTMGMVRGWHGTPHRFDPVEHNPFGEFRDAAIGTGEGAQAYGHGHYVAGNRETAEAYRSRLSRGEEGNLLDVKIKPDEHEMLDWDKPLSQQHPSVMEKLENIAGDIKPSDIDRGQSWYDSLSSIKGAKSWKDLTGEDLYRYLAVKAAGAKGPVSYGQQGKDAEASKLLHEAGIPGIKYADQGSRDLNPAHGGVIVDGKNLTGSKELPQLKWNEINKITAGEDEAFAADSALSLLHKTPDVNKVIDSVSTNVQKQKENMSREIGRDPGLLMGNSASRYNLAKSHLEQATGTLNWLEEHRKRISFAPAEKQTNNYVIFHPSNLKITGRNGQMLEPVDHNPWAASPGGND